MEKKYKVTYKTFFDERINKVSFHDQETHPLYLQVTYRRRTIFFKSALFEHLLKSKFSIYAKKPDTQTVLERIIEKEVELLNWTAAHLPQDFTLDDFKLVYEFYSKDLFSLTEADFRLYMYLFLQKKRAFIIASLMSNKSRDFPLYYVLKDMKKTFDRELYNELIKGVFSYGFLAPPYLILYGFIKRKSNAPYFLTIMDWEKSKTEKAFLEYAEKLYPDKSPIELSEMIDRRIALENKKENEEK